MVNGHMTEVNSMKLYYFNFAISGVGTLISILFGEWSPLLTLFFTVIVIDYITGIFASIIDGKGLSSSYGLKGIVKKFAIVLIVILAKMLDGIVGTNIIMTGALYFFISNELISIVENYGRMKLPLPKQIKNIISVLKDKSND